jgi:hypothetical protein
MSEIYQIFPIISGRVVRHNASVAWRLLWRVHGDGLRQIRHKKCCAPSQIHSQMTLYASNISNAVCANPPEDEQVMLETCRCLWFSINWMESASRWYKYTDILSCTVSITLSYSILNYTFKCVRTRTTNQLMHCSDSLLITFYTCYMFRRMYVIIRESSFVSCWVTLKISTVCIVCQIVFIFSGCS